jgi:WhiB family redox-sensing transcriptional regulator
MPDGVRPEYIDDEFGEEGSLLDMLARTRPEWQKDALCREYPDVDFFATGRAGVDEARRVCSKCLVLVECRSWALEQDARLDGVWGGTTLEDRRKMRRPGRPGRKAA